MADESDTTPIHSLYAQRFAADIETNRKEQEVVSAQIVELEERLKQLREDESWLSGVQSTLPAPTSVDAPDRAAVAAPAQAPVAVEAPAPGAVPKPRQAKKAAPRAPRVKKTAPAKTAPAKVREKPAAATGTPAAKAKPASRGPATAAAPAPAKEATSPAAGRNVPPLRELVLDLLVRAGEPLMVSEVTTKLAEVHPGRPASTQVVRNTLEALAKKGSIEKEHKQGSVMYTAPAPAPVVAAAPATAPTPDEADDKTAEKASA